MSKNTDEIIEILNHIPSEEKDSARKLFDSLLKVAIRSESRYGYKGGAIEYTNSIYLAY